MKVVVGHNIVGRNMILFEKLSDLSRIKELELF